MAGTEVSSYPPLFREEKGSIHGGVEGEEGVKVGGGSSESDPLPVMDLECMEMEKLGEVCREWGIFRLVNHGIPLSLLSQLEDHAKRLFGLPFESKEAIFTTPVSYFWGTPALTKSGVALSQTPQNVNWVEGFNVPLSQLPLLQTQDPIIASFRLILEEYGRHLSRIARTLFDAMAKNLGHDPKQYESSLDESSGIVRVYRYPLRPNRDHASHMEVHTDSSVLSILNQDEVGGLEVLKDGEWLSASPISNTLVINVGDMMQVISNDDYKSVIHRVKVAKERERLSICYFVFPEENTVIKSSKYRPFSYNDFRSQVQDDIKTLGHKVGLERFKVNDDSD
ncbi:gibberellin 2-beta-dioxygenase 6-like [Vitis riparia]|uniref:gibberellin 2-beta-dioxygenase 6-like n=1 Tax=Vitis riparia TaxID=96939 RepID=UPI00155A94B4|nr:gibberellin 2-beta-dioxygenase 6-like [Vitis riparia]